MDDAFVRSEEEAANVEDALQGCGSVNGMPIEIHLLDPFTSGELESALEGKEAFVIPELQSGPLSLSDDDNAALVNFVDAGGALLVYGDINGRYADVLNSAFGWSIAQDSYTTSGEALLDTVAAAGTVFFDAAAAVPGSNAIYFAELGSLPSEARGIYNNGEEGSWLFLVPRGPGGVAFIANDFWADTQDIAWLEATCKALTPQLL
jgi:hypothetical protein